MDRLRLYLQFDRPLGEEERAAVRALVRRRGDHVPVAYLVGTREFWSLPFHVDERVLVPRPETEHLVEVGLAGLAAVEEPVFADVGTGSGCVAVALLVERERARGHGIDVSAAALAVARRNAERHGVLGRLALHEGEWLAPLARTPDHGRLDAVLSNPPYLVEGDPSVERGVRDHEPHEALFAPGDDPLAPTRRLAREALDALAPGGLLAFEVGVDLAPIACALLADLGYADVEATPDLAGIDRVVSGRRRRASGYRDALRGGGA